MNRMSRLYFRKQYIVQALRNDPQKIRWNCFPRLFYLMLALVMSVGPSLAETIVSGEVSGVWDTDGSPYLVTDTLIVPEGDTLLIEPGVTVEFQDQDSTNQYSIVLDGVLIAVGNEQDSIFFLSEEYPFSGIESSNTALARRLLLDYCVFAYADRPVDVRHCITTIRNSRLLSSSTLIINSRYGIDTLVSNTFIANNILLSADVVLHSSENALVADNNCINTNLCIDIENSVGLCYGNTCEALDVSGGTAEIHDNIMKNSYCARGNYYYHNNVIEGAHQDHGIFIDSSHVQIINNILEASYALLSTGVMRNNVIISDEYMLEIPIELNRSHFTINNNIISSYTNAVECDINSDLIFYNNTVQFRRNGIYLTNADSSSFWNNIFLGDGVNCTGINCSVGNLPLETQYNCFWNVSQAVSGYTLDSTNFVMDPCFSGGDPFDYHLQANSPCIDAGDPSSPEDPDGTLADIGCFYYDQSLDNPPVQTFPEDIFAQTGQLLRIQITATDDNGPFNFTFTDLPEWLTEDDELDWVSDTTVVSGTVPEDAEDFSFTVIVEDGEGQTDSSIVSVDVDQRTLLSGEISGILHVEESPFYVVEDIIVPEGDSLVIEPGCELQFRYVQDEEQLIGLDVYGKLIAEGTAEDSIKIEGEITLQPGQWSGIYFYLQTDTSRFDHCVIHDAIRGLRLGAASAAEIKNTTITSLYTSVLSGYNSSVVLDSCILIAHPNAGVLIDLYGCDFSITNSLLICDMDEQDTFPIYTNDSCHIFIDNTKLTGGKAIIVGNNTYAEVYRCEFKNMFRGISFSSGGTGIVTNSIFKNMGYNMETGAGISISSLPLQVHNNIFINNYMGLRMCIGPLGGDSLLYNYNNVYINNNYALYSELSEIYLENTEYNSFENNEYDIYNGSISDNNIYVNPCFYDTTNFYLYDNSPLIDSGNPDSFYNDVDSTRNDIGLWGGHFGQAYEYPLAIIENNFNVPRKFSILATFPNPFNSSQTISFSLPECTLVELRLSNLLGQSVLEIEWSQLQPGVHRKSYDASNLASGVYFVQLQAGKERRIRRVILLK